MNEIPNAPPNESAAGDAELAAFDDLLRTAMQARPEPVAPSDLAMRAMALAASTSSGQAADDSVRLSQAALLLARQRWWAQVASIAAALLIVAMLVGAGRKMWTRGDIAAMTTSNSVDTTSEDGTSTDAETPAQTSTSTSSITSTVAVVFVAELLVLGVILMSISRRAPTMPWGAEALAGFW